MVGLLLLHFQHLSHLRVGLAEFQLPTYQLAINVDPILPTATVHNLHGQLLELLLIVGLYSLSHDFPTVYVFLQCQQNLVGVDGLDKIVSYLLSNGLVHDVLLLALGYHHHRGLWR